MEMTAVDIALAEATTAKDVIVICLDEDGNVRLLSSMTYAPDIAWSMRIAEDQLLDMHLELDS